MATPSDLPTILASALGGGVGDALTDVVGPAPVSAATGVLLADGAVREIRHLPNVFSLSKPYRYA